MCDFGCTVQVRAYVEEVMEVVDLTPVQVSEKERWIV
jgi:hypothetical protein